MLHRRRADDAPPLSAARSARLRPTSCSATARPVVDVNDRKAAAAPVGHQDGLA